VGGAVEDCGEEVGFFGEGQPTIKERAENKTGIDTNLEKTPQ